MEWRCVAQEGLQHGIVCEASDLHQFEPEVCTFVLSIALSLPSTRTTTTVDPEKEVRL